ncbi:NAD(P) transhydrogenase subunit alpha [Sphaerisporangium dianthi]|uniref:proton-translocating NAD(P)(+) transhydrogenase n=1 Tax=Sphaerisporangium dianthi TaxID=1436120 RepID=A0ABV9CIG2_9ACTN
MNATKAGVVKETAPGERRVALSPDGVARLGKAGIGVLVESGAGAAAWFSDGAYIQAGAEIATRDELYARAEAVLTVGPPAAAGLRRGQVVIGLSRPAPAEIAALAGRGVTAICFEGLPRTISAAQPMDAMTSQATIAGYRAAVLAAGAYGRLFPLLITAAGTAPPAQVLVLGAGVAGLQAIGTARRLGAVVTGFDVRPAAREEVASLGAAFLGLASAASAAGEGGYARALTAPERQAQQEELAGHVARFDIVITTAQVPGRRPPLLVTEAGLKTMRPGSVVVDLAAGEFGGNVEASVPGETVVTGEGVTVIGAGNLASTMPAAASTAYSSNVCALLAHLMPDGALAIDLGDAVQAGVVVTHAGRIVHPVNGAATAARQDGGST